MEPTIKATPPPDLVTLLGGVEMTVKLNNGTTETVRVRQIPIKLFPQLGAALDNEPKLVDLYCDKPEGWSEGLTMEDFESVLERGEGINSPFFTRWLNRRRERQEKAMPGLAEKIQQGLLLASQTSLPK